MTNENTPAWAIMGTWRDLPWLTQEHLLTPQKLKLDWTGALFYLLPLFFFPYTSPIISSTVPMAASPIDMPDPFIFKTLWCQLKAWFSPDQSQKTQPLTVDPRLHMLHTHSSTRNQRLRRRTLTTYELPDDAVGSNVHVAS
jgi:hypothetical protein